MKLDLEVLASTTIQRRKPWPKILWIGEEQESLLLLDAAGHRTSVLYVPSGKTKRKLPKLSALVDQTLCYSRTNNGRYLLGLLQSGELFVWHKDKDVIKIIPGLSKQTKNYQAVPCYITASDDCAHVFLAVGTSLFFLWEMEKGESISKDRDAELKGTWHKIITPTGMELPNSDSKECSLAGIFYTSLVLGTCCQFSVIYNSTAMLSIITLLLKFPDPADSFGKSLPIFSAEWSLLEYPFEQMHPNFEPICTAGAYVSSYCGNGQVLAVAANQRHPSQTAMLFVSPLTDTVLVAGMKGCGVSDPNKAGRPYWVGDLSWTSDSLFLACILNNGSVCLMSRLGEPVIIQTDGCSVTMGPSHYLALHPAIFVSDNKGSLEPSAAEQDPMGQHFSLATHPSLPIILFSDGFLVTVVQLPVDVNSATMMRDLVLESARYLKKVYEQENLDMTVADAYKLSKGHKNAKQAHDKEKMKKVFEFELAEISLNSTHESEVSMIDTTNKFGFDQFGAIGNMDSGKIVFGEPEMISIDPNATFSGLDASEALLKYLEEAMTALVLSWKLAATYPDMWTADVDNIAKQAVHNLSKIFSIVLDCPAVEAIIPVLTPRQSSAIQNPRVYNIIVAYRNILQLLRFDKFNQHLIPAALRLVHKTITLMLCSKELESTDPRLKTLFGCYSLLKHAETSLNKIYDLSSTQSQTSSPDSTGQNKFVSTLMEKFGKQVSPRGSGTSQQQGVHQMPLPGKRLAMTWKLLYKHLLQYQNQLLNSGDPSGELQHLDKLMSSIQQTLQESDSDITPRKGSSKLSIGDKYSVDGDHTLAVEAWKEQLRTLAATKADSPKTAKMLHAILYTHLIKGELGQAVDFIDGLIMQASVAMATSGEEFPIYDDGSRPPLMTLVSHRSQDSNEEELVPCIKNKSIRQTVQTMARFMAAYFSNEPMFIFPPHSAQPLPSVHMSSQPTKSRIIPKYHEDITNIIRRDNLSIVWTTERTVEYLLLSGLICETAWFASKMGDWKTAYMLSVAHVSHRDIAEFLYRKPKKPLQLPVSLSPEALIQDKLQIMIQSNTADSAPVGKKKRQRRYFIPINQETNIPQLTKTLQDVFLAGIICQVEVAPWFLASLVEKLKAVVAGLTSLVPDDFYLPSPPLYCPQPGEVEMSTERPDVEYEKELRLEISSLIQLILVALNSAHLSLPVARWYIQELFKVQERAAQFKSTTEGPCLELPEILQQYKILRSTIVDFKDDPHVHQVLCSFRDFCTVLWLLHVRDELSLQLRKRGNQLHNEKTDGQDSAESTLAQSWVQECFKTLKWAVQLLAFSQYITDDGCIHKVLLSLILELPPTEDMADILAEHFYIAESLDPEVQEKLERVLSDWKSIEIHPEDDGKSARLDEQPNDDEKNDEDGDDVRKSVTFYDASPRAKTLSVYYHKQCEVVQKVLKKKRKRFGYYEEFVFSYQQTDENVVLNSIQNGGSIFIGSRPFETKQSYLEFLDRFYAISFTKLVEQESEQSRNPVFPSLMPFSKLIREAEFEAFQNKNAETFQKKTPSIVLSSPRAKFVRSQSESHVQEAGDPETVVSSNQKNRGLFRSSSSGDVQPPRGSYLLKYQSEGSLMVKNSPRNRSQRPGMSPTRATPNMTGMASRFFQSEDVLYRELGESQEAHWVLNVNFGETYLSLQRLLDWLHHWCCKQHSLGLHGKNEKDTALKPTMRIEVPTQLVVLSLWLLEHKYSQSKRKRAAQTPNEVIEKNFEIEDVNFLDDKQKIMKQKALATVEEVTEHDSFTQVSNIAPRSRSHSPYHSRTRSPANLRSRSHSPAADSREATLDYYRSITSTMEETEQIHSAYKKVLNDDESSSLEVSSLEPDEYEEDLKHTLSLIGSEHKSRSRTPKKKSSSRRRQDKNSPDSRNNSTLNNTLHFEVSPERANVSQNAPQTSTPLRNSRRKNREEIQEDISHISLPPSGQPGLYTAPSRGNINNNAPSGVQFGHNTAPPEHYRGGLLGGDPGHTVPGAGSHGVSAPSENLAGDIGQQLQQIVRGELRKMLEVQHQSMMAMMGALDGQVPQIPVSWQPDHSANQRQVHPSSQSLSPPRRGYQEEQIIERQGYPVGKNLHRGVLSELHNLQLSEEKEGRRRKSRSPGGTLRAGKENHPSSALHLSDLRGPGHPSEDIQLYRVENEGPSNINFTPKFLRIPAERDTNVPTRFPHIPSEAWAPRQDMRPREDVPDMPLLHVDRTVPGHVFPGSQRSRSLPKYLPQQGYFQPPHGSVYQPPPPPVLPHPGVEGTESPDSGIGIPLLRIPTDEERAGRQPRFGELLPPDVVIENERERQQKELLREKYAREFHQLHAKQADERDKQRFGENLLHLSFKNETDAEIEIERQVKRMMKKQVSPRKTHDSVIEEISSRQVSKKSSARPKTPESVKSKSVSISRKSRSVHDKEAEEGAELDERAETEEEAEPAEDETEAESIEEEQEEQLHDGYAFRQGEFEAYLALEKELAHTKDTNARIQLMTALKLQQRRMVENWKRPRPRPKVDFATMTREHVDAEMETDFAMETESIRTAEKYTSITKDTGVDPIQEAVIEYNKNRQPAVLPPDIYMGLRFADTAQPSSDVTGQQESARGRAYLNVVDVDASAILRDLHEKPEADVESRLDVSMPPTQAHLRDRMAQESGVRESLEPPVIERPTRADELTVKMFETKAPDGDRLSIAVMPRDSLPASKAAIFSRLRDMNQQLAAIDRMSNNMEREFKSTRLAIGTLEQMTDAMAPPARDRRIDEGIMEEDERGPSPAGSRGSRSLTPQMSAKSPTLSARATGRSTARSKKSTVHVEDKQALSTELAKMSGLSGISDIIGDMVAKGEINLEDAGLTPGEADQLVHRGVIRHEEVEEARVSLDEIKKMAKTVSKAPDFSRDNLHEWMATKRQQRMEEYKRHLEELREREAQPFKHKPGEIDHTFTTRELQESEHARQDHRKMNTRAFMSKRLAEAQHLLGNILTDKPDLPKEPPKSDRKQKLQRKDTSPVTKDRKGKPYAKEFSPSRKVTSILKTRDTSPGKARDYSPPSFRSLQQPEFMDQYDDLMYDQQVSSPREAQPAPSRPHKVVVAPAPERPPHRIDVAPSKKTHPGVPRLKLSLEDVDEEPRFQQTIETTGDLSEYARAMEDMDESQELRRDVVRQQEQEEEKKGPPPKPYKHKPYTEIVRVQRPEATRKKPPTKSELAYQGRLQSMSQSEAGTARTETTQREREMIYGSKRLPMKKPTETTPRRVKTYTERLQEMKTEKKFSTPVAPRSQYGSSVASGSARDWRPGTRVVKPKHKPMTYVEQLQKLNEGTHKPRMGQTTVINKTMVKSHKPAHKPKTYAQQLKELQPAKTVTGPPSKRSHKPPSTRTISRQRPYKDPYMPVSHEDYDKMDRESVVSAWSMGDDVRHILYDDAASSIAVGQSASYAPSEQVSDYYDAVMGDDYTASVDIDDLVRIADDGSDASEGLFSNIDWDEVEDLIADVS